MASTVLGIGVALVQSPIYGLICLGFMMILFLIMSVFGSALKKAAFAKIEVSKELGAMIEEHLTAQKLIASFA